MRHTWCREKGINNEARSVAECFIIWQKMIASNLDIFNNCLTLKGV